MVSRRVLHFPRICLQRRKLVAKAKEWEELRAERGAPPMHPAATESYQGRPTGQTLPRLPKPGRTALEQVRAWHAMHIAHLYAHGASEVFYDFSACERKVSIVRFAITTSYTIIYFGYAFFECLEHPLHDLVHRCGSMADLSFMQSHCQIQILPSFTLSSYKAIKKCIRNI